ncbi:ATP-binding cassette subfamily B protein AbcA/BmrA [Fontibacillus solani]|uniref:ATP-binding cassette subfamily B protein AbcA/BmrA n=2 Tax=Fontibacillus solani TaxID=1572857 RepID=A0A7W3SUM5_9BACL|nr:ATP-binding cassette subfamily B protein AbcA/BmrA [Fontibacillus solani]
MMMKDNGLKDQIRRSGGAGSFIRLLREAKPSVALFTTALLLSVISTLVSLVIPMVTKNIVDGFSLASLDRTQIIALVAAFTLQTLAGGISIFLFNYIGQKIVAALRDRLWKKLLVLPVRYFDNHHSGESVSRMTNDTGVIKTFISEHLASFFSGIISIIGSIAVLLYLNWQMTLIMFIVIPLSALIIAPLGRKMYKISLGMQDETASLASILTQVLSEIRLVKASNAEDKEYGNGNRGITKLLSYGIREGLVMAWIGPIVSVVLMMLLVVVIGYGGMQVSTGALTAGELVAFILYLVQIVMPMTQLTTFFTQFQKSIGATERIISTLEEDEENFGSGKAVEDGNHAVTIENLSFGYKDNEPVLQNVSFRMEPGTITAVVGPSGSGKTTLFSLLERFYLPQEGRVALADESIEDFSLRSWRENIGYVSQDSPMIAGTIRDNLCYGAQREISDEELRKAAEMAYADGFIHELPDGFDTDVGERGVKLSGGQRQRIAIARALLRNPKILMLDEATSSLDSHSETVVQQALNNLMQGRTTMVIAHRLSTVVGADQIVFIEKGKVTGKGTHEQLLQHHAMYRKFATQQLQLAEKA